MFRFYFVFCLFFCLLWMCLEQTWSLFYITVLIERHRKHTYLPSIDLSAFFRHKEGKSGCVAPPPRKKRKDRGETRRRSTTRQSTTRHAQKTHTQREQQRRRERDDDKSDDDDDADDVRVVRRRCFFASKSKRKIETSAFSSPEIKSFDDDE